MFLDDVIKMLRNAAATVFLWHYNDRDIPGVGRLTFFGLVADLCASYKNVINKRPVATLRFSSVCFAVTPPNIDLISRVFHGFPIYAVNA